MQLKHILYLYIQSQNADPSPPLGTILGNLGINTVNFCKDFNNYTSDLPKYITVSVKLLIYTNRSVKYEITSPSLSSIINLLIYVEENQRKILLKDILKLSKWKFPKLPVQQSLPIVMGMLRSFQLKIALNKEQSKQK